MNGPVRIAWRGVLGWVLLVLSFVLGCMLAYPANGLTLAAIVMAVVGTALVGSVVHKPAPEGEQ